jgi:hypothetical protein
MNDALKRLRFRVYCTSAITKEGGSSRPYSTARSGPSISEVSSNLNDAPMLIGEVEVDVSVALGGTG